MLEKIKQEEQLELLKLFGIEIKDGKFVKTATGEKFVQYDIEKTQRNGVFNYRCGDTIVKVNAICPSDPIPCSIIITEDNIDYCTYKIQSGRGIKDNQFNLTINCSNKGKFDEEYGIEIRPEMGDSFIRTVIKSPKGESEVLCSFDNKIRTDLRRYDTGGSWGDPFSYGETLSLDNYTDLIKRMIEYVFEREPKLVEAYLKCLPIIIKGYLNYVDFPKKHETEYDNYFDIQEGYCNNAFASTVHHALDAANNGKQPEKIEELATKYVSDSLKIRSIATEAMKKRDEQIATIEKQRDNFREFVKNCWDDKNPAKAKIKAESNH